MRSISIGVVFAGIAAVVLQGQVSPTVKLQITDGTTPPALATGAPLGSYLTNDIEQVNYYNGKVNLTIPLLEVGGRGEARYTITALAHQPTWTMRVDHYADNISSSSSGCDPATTTCFKYIFTSTPELERSEPQWQPGYGPGRLLVKKAADNLRPCYYGTAAGTPDYHILSEAMTYVVFVAPDGTEHGLYAADSGINVKTCALVGSGGTGAFRGYTFGSRDGSGMTFVATPPGGGAIPGSLVDRHDPAAYPNESVQSAPDGVLYMKNGVRYVQQGGLVRSMTDRNGNTLTFTYAQVTSGTTLVGTNLVSEIQDAAGRKIQIGYGEACSPAVAGCEMDRISFKAQNGEVKSVRVVRRQLQNAYASSVSLTTPLFVNHNASATEHYGSGFVPVITGVLLPHQVDGSTPGYEMRYTRYGEVATLKAPSGSFTTYTHDSGKPGATSNGSNGIWTDGQVLSRLAGQVRTDIGPGARVEPLWRPFVYRRLLRKDVYTDEGGTLVHWTTISRAEDTSSSTAGLMVEVERGGASVTNSVKERHYYVTRGENCIAPQGQPSCVTSIVNVSNYQDTPANSLQLAPGLRGFNDEWQGKEFKTEWPGVRRVERAYGPVNNAALVCREDEVAIGQATPTASLRKKTATTYDSFENPSVVYEYGYESGGTFPTAAGATGSGVVCPSGIATGYIRRRETDYAYTNYTAAPVHLRSLVKETRTYEGAAATASARTTLSFDGASLLSRADAVSWTSPGTSFRGNVTGVSTMVKKVQSGAAEEAAVTYSFGYDDLGNVVTATDARGQALTYSYDDSFTGWITDLAAGKKSYAFRKSVQFPTPGAEAWPLSGGVIKATSTYDFALGQLREFLDVNGVRSDVSYADTTAADPYGRVRSAAMGASLGDPRQTRKTSYTYVDTAGSLSVTMKADQLQSDDLRLQTVTRFDRLGRKYTTEAGTTDTIFQDEVLDGLGRVFQRKNPRRSAAEGSDGTTTISYDGAGRVTAELLPDGSSIATAYEIDTTNLALQTDVTEAAVKRRTFTDGLGRVAKVIEYPVRGDTVTSEETSYSYDVLDHLTGVTQGTQTRTFLYDSAGRLREATNPENGTIIFGYDGNGNLISKTEQGGYSTTLSYDNWNRLIGKVYSGGPGTKSVIYCYDGKSADASGCTGSVTAGSVGRQTGVTNGDSWTTYSYNGAGRVTALTQTTKRANGTTVAAGQSYAYWVDGSVARQVLPSSRGVVSCYDSNGRVNWVSRERTETECISSTIGAGKSWYADGVTYAPHGGLKGLTLGNGLAEGAVFNNRMQVGEMTLGSGGSVWKLVNEYTRTGVVNNGNVWKQRLTIPGKPVIVTAFDYDGVNRLTVAEEGPANENAAACTGAAAGNWCQKFSYDRWGNRLVAAKFGVGQGASVLDPGAVSAGTNQVTGGNWHYNGRGDLDTDGDGRKYSYDAEGRLVSTCGAAVALGSCNALDAGGTWEARYVYDGNGKRVRRDTQVGGVVTSVVWGYDAGGKMVAEYGVGEGLGGVQYVTGDHLGSTRVVTDGGGVAVGRWDYEPFGAEIGVVAASARSGVAGYVGGVGVRQRFTSKQRDLETGLDYFGARYFSGVAGRFTSADVPLADQQVGDGQSWNLYSYGRNSPLRFVDEDGRGVKEGVANWVDRTGGAFVGLVLQPEKTIPAVANGVWNAVANPRATLTAIGAGFQSFASASFDEKITTLTEVGLDIGSAALTGGASRGTAIGTTLKELPVLANAQNAVDAAIAGMTKAERKATAMVVGAYDIEKGTIAVGKSGPMEGAVNPQVNAAAQRVGGVGARNAGCAPVGHCAEFKAYNTLTQQGSNIKNVRHTTPIRPRTGDPHSLCSNCERMFPE